MKSVNKNHLQIDILHLEEFENIIARVILKFRGSMLVDGEGPIPASIDGLIQMDDR